MSTTKPVFVMRNSQGNKLLFAEGAFRNIFDYHYTKAIAIPSYTMSMANTGMILLNPGLATMLRTSPDTESVPRWRASCVIRPNDEVAEGILVEMERVWPNLLYVTKERSKSPLPQDILPGYGRKVEEYFEEARKVLFAVEGVSVDMITSIRVIAMVVILGVAPATVRGQ